jgi:hypothetical protein
MIANSNIKKKDQSHITQMFLPGKHKAKNLTIIYYVYIMDHETISYKTLIQEISVQYTIVSHCHTKIGKLMCQFTASRQPASFAQSLLMENLQMNLNSSYLGCAFLMGTSTVCVIALVHSLKSQLIVKLSLSPVISTGSPLDLTCM